MGSLLWLVTITITVLFVSCVSARTEFYAVEEFTLDFDYENSQFLGGELDTGVYQTYPDIALVHLRTNGETIDLVLNVKRNLFNHESTIQWHHADEDSVSTRHTLNSYSSVDGHDRASMTVLSDGLVSMVIMRKGKKMLQIDPLRAHRGEMDSVLYQSFVDEGYELIMHKASETQAGRKLLQSFPDDSFRWDNCFEVDDDTVLGLPVGIAMDYGYYKESIDFDADNELAQIEAIFAQMNLIYEPQLGVSLQIGEVIVKKSLDSDTWNMDPATGCNLNISTLLTTWDDYVKSDLSESTMGLWHQMTDCYPPPGTVGIAYLNSVCYKAQVGLITGINTDSGTSTWLTVAHEIGHNFGAEHSFEEGQGSTGGIMDYGDGTLDGVYQFNSEYREDQICAILSDRRTNTAWFVNQDCFEVGTAETVFFEYIWEITSDYSECSAECGNSGTQSRDVVCVNEDSEVVDDTFCDSSSMPLRERECNRIECPDVDTCSCTDWSEYSACVEGEKTRSRECTSTEEVDTCEPNGFYESSTVECTLAEDGITDVTTCVTIDLGRHNIPDRDTFKDRVKSYLPRWTSNPHHDFDITHLKVEDDQVTFGFTAKRPTPMQYEISPLGRSSPVESETTFATTEEMARSIRNGGVPHALGAFSVLAADSCDNEPEGSNAGIYAGVGIGVGIVAIGGGVFFYRRRSARKWDTAQPFL